MPPTVDDDTRIKKGLKYLAKEDRVAIRAARILKKHLGEPYPPKPKDLMADRKFTVAGSDYYGEMTDLQYGFLAAKTSTLKKFADAIAMTIAQLDLKIAAAVQGFDGELVESAARAKSAKAAGDDGANAVSDIGCCSYDTNLRTECTQSTCVGGLAGDSWVKGVCIKVTKRRPTS